MLCSWTLTALFPDFSWRESSIYSCMTVKVWSFLPVLLTKGYGLCSVNLYSSSRLKVPSETIYLQESWPKTSEGQSLLTWRTLGPESESGIIGRVHNGLHFYVGLHTSECRASDTELSRADMLTCALRTDRNRSRLGYAKVSLYCEMACRGILKEAGLRSTQYYLVMHVDRWYPHYSQTSILAQPVDTVCMYTFLFLHSR